MSKFKEASENIQRLSVMFSGLNELGVELEKISSIENHVNELNAKKTSLAEEVDTLQSIYDEEKAQTEIIKKQNEDKIKAANVQAEKIIVDARAEAVAVAANAARISDDAKVACRDLQADYKKQIELAKVELADLNKQCQAESDRLDLIKAEISRIKSM